MLHHQKMAGTWDDEACVHDNEMFGASKHIVRFFC
jgi:hypothetical protein